MSDADTDLIFKGHTPGSISCEDFVRAVRKYANSEKKSRDDEFIADYVMGCLADDALHWSETLSREVQGDWSLLRRALLEEFGTSDRKPVYMAPSLPNAMVPVPAAAPPLTPLPRLIPQAVNSQILRGRVQVIASGATSFLSDQTHDESSIFFRGVCVTTTNVSDACILSGTIVDEEVQFVFESLNPALPSVGMQLGMVWQVPDPLAKHSSNAALTPVDIQGPNPTIMNPAYWKGPVSWVTWICRPNNTLILKLEGMPDAGIITSQKSLLVASHASSFLEANSTWKKADLVFVPI